MIDRHAPTRLTPPEALGHPYTQEITVEVSIGLEKYSRATAPHNLGPTGEIAAQRIAARRDDHQDV